MMRNFIDRYKNQLDVFIKNALNEDIGIADHTSLSCIDAEIISSAKLIVKESGYLAGVSLSKLIFEHYDRRLKVEIMIEDGSRIKKGDIAFKVHGSTLSILSTERLVLNTIQRMSSIASLTKGLAGTNMNEFGLLNKKGIIGYTDGTQTIQNTRLMSRIMRSAFDLDALVIQHAEDNELSKDGQVNDGIIATKLGLQGIPDYAEKIIIERDLTLLEDFNCRYHIAQISSEKSVEIIKNRKEIVKFTTGVSINNLSLNQNDIGDFRTFLKLSPPLRTEEDRLSLIKGINQNLIDVIVSDHKPEDEESKRLTFSQAATGASGIETLLPLALELFHNGSIKLNKIIECLTCNPAKILKINKGSLSVGSDADLCIVDIYKPWVVKKEKMISKSKNTCIEDKKLQGKVLSTFVNGVELFKC